MGNEENLISLKNRTPEELKEITTRGWKASVEKRKENAEKNKQIDSLAEILKRVLYAKIKPNEVKDIMDQMGFEKNSNYFAALSASVMLKGIKDGDVSVLAKIMEVLGEAKNTKSDINLNLNTSYNNLLEAINNARQNKIDK